MSRSEDPFLARWTSLSDAQRKFLLSAYEIDRTIGRRGGLVPIIPWRTAGIMCGRNPGESDELVAVLADLGLVHAFSADKHQMCLTAYYEIRRVLEAQRQRQFERVLLAVAVLVVLARVLSAS